MQPFQFYHTFHLVLRFCDFAKALECKVAIFCEFSPSPPRNLESFGSCFLCLSLLSLCKEDIKINEIYIRMDTS